MYGQIAHTINSVFVTVCGFSGNVQPNQFHSLTSWYREHRINVTIPKLIYIEKVCWSVENLHSLHLMFWAFVCAASEIESHHSIPLHSVIPLPFISINNGVRHYTIIFPYTDMFRSLYLHSAFDDAKHIWIYVNQPQIPFEPRQVSLFYHCGLPYKP